MFLAKRDEKSIYDLIASSGSVQEILKRQYNVLI